jgi:hypothetical protein
MRFLKQQNLSRYGLRDNALFVTNRPLGHTNDGSKAIMDLTGALRLPKGTENQRPEITGIVAGANGFIRYNTSTNPLTGLDYGLEAYIGGVWETVKAPGAGTIVKQTIGPGNYAEEYFGPLSIVPASADNIIVLVENVFQISTTNFELIQNPPGLAQATYGTVVTGAPYPAGWYLKFQEPVPLDKNVTVYFGFSN